MFRNLTQNTNPMPIAGEHAAAVQSSTAMDAAPAKAGTTALVPELQLVKPTDLCGDLAASWRSIHATNPSLRSPYFNLNFTQAVARVRDDVEVAVFTAENEVVALLPFQRASARHAVPVGGRLNDSHGMLVRRRAESALDCRELISRTMKAAGLDSFAFHALSQTDESLRPYEFRELRSHFMDLTEGWDAYHGWAKKNSVAIKRQGQKTRKLDREVGTVRFEFDCKSHDVLETLIELKRAKYQRGNTFDILSVQWASNLLREIMDIDEPGFKGILSVLWAGDQLVAVHMGMLTDNILHYWFPVYDPAFRRYSPGTEILLQAGQMAAATGLDKVDLGYGDDDYKFRFCNGRETVSCGLVNFSPLAFAVAKQRYLIRQKLKGIPMKPLVKSVLRGVFPGFGQWNFK